MHGAQYWKQPHIVARPPPLILSPSHLPTSPSDSFILPNISSSSIEISDTRHDLMANSFSQDYLHEFHSVVGHSYDQWLSHKLNTRLYGCCGDQKSTDAPNAHCLDPDSHFGADGTPRVSCERGFIPLNAGYKATCGLPYLTTNLQSHSSMKGFSRRRTKAELQPFWVAQMLPAYSETTAINNTTKTFTTSAFAKSCASGCKGLLPQTPPNISPLKNFANLPLPPPAYADTVQEQSDSSEKAMLYSQTEDISALGHFTLSRGGSIDCVASQNSTNHDSPKETTVTNRSKDDDASEVSDIFSQRLSTPSSSSAETSPITNTTLLCRQEEDVGNSAVSTGFQPLLNGSSTPQSIAASVVSSARSPVKKRGRFIPDDTSADNSTSNAPTAATVLLDPERYRNEYVKDTYDWLSYQETTKYSIGASFMEAQKKEGASCFDRRAVLLRAITDMRMRKHSLEAIHLGAYILDKCLDSFHIAKSSLPDVCAISMVLGTKMEEYDSLLPGNAIGLFGATTDKARLCDVEKRVVYELNYGLCFPTPLVFAHYMLCELESGHEEIRFTQFLLELALLEPYFRDYGGPNVAHAAVCLSLAVVNQDHASRIGMLKDVEEKLINLTGLPVGSTRHVMSKIALEIYRAMQEKHPIFVDYICEGNKRLRFCEISRNLWSDLNGTRETSNGY